MTDYLRIDDVPAGAYDVVLADPPWSHYGSPTKMAAAGKHYALMSDAELMAMPVHRILARPAVLFLWATCPRLDMAMKLIESWGLTYRGVAFVWVKTRQDGAVIGAQGVRPSIVKPTTELVLAASNVAKGRPMRLHSEAVPQVVMAPRQEHSQKPDEVRLRIESLYRGARRIELFARGVAAPWWDRFGNELG